jgi:hypothetical protein
MDIDPVELTGEIFNVCFSLLSIIGSIIVFVSFITSEQVFKKKMKQRDGGISLMKRTLIRRTMLSMCVADILLGIFNIIYVMFFWIVTYGSTYYDQERVDSAARLLGQFILGFSMSSSTWCVCIAAAIYTSTMDTLDNSHSIQLVLNHAWGWGVGILSFFTFFIFRQYANQLELPIQIPRSNELISSTYYLLFALYMLVIMMTNIIILVLIFRYVRYTLNAVQAEMRPKKATIRARTRIITRLGFYLVPFLVSGSFQMIWYFYLSVDGFRGERNPQFVRIFTFLYNIFFPMHGFLNCIAYGIGMDYFTKLCSCYRKKQVLMPASVAQELINNELYDTTSELPNDIERDE